MNIETRENTITGLYVRQLICSINNMLEILFRIWKCKSDCILVPKFLGPDTILWERFFGKS